MLNWLLVAGLALLMTPTEYGRVSLFVAVHQLGLAGILLGLDRALLRFTADAEEDSVVSYHTSILWLAAAGISLLVTLVTLEVLRVESVWGLPRSLVALLLVGIVAVGGHRLQLALLRTRGSARAYAVVRIGFQLLLIFATLLALRALGDARAYVLGLAIAGTPMAVVALYQMVPRPRPSIEPARLSELWSFGWPLTFHMVAGGVLVYIDRFMLDHYVGLEGVGVYSAAYVIASSVTMVYALLGVSVEPVIYRDSERVQHNLSLYASGGIAVTAGMAIVFLGAVGLADSSGRLADYGAAAPLLPTLLAAHVLHGIYMRANYSLALTRRTKWLAGTTVAAAILNTVLNLALIPLWGLRGAATATFLSYLVTNVALYGVAQRLGGGRGLPGDHRLYALVVVCLIVISSGIPAWTAMLIFGFVVAAAALRFRHQLNVVIVA